jgi:hypothetical protein
MLSMLGLGHGWLAGGPLIIIIYYPILESFFDRTCLRPLGLMPFGVPHSNSSPTCSKSPTPGSVLRGHKELDYLPARTACEPRFRQYCAVTYYNRAEVPPYAASISGPALPLPGNL